MKKLLFLFLLTLTGCEPDTIKTAYFRITYDREYCVVSATQQTAEIVCTKPAQETEK